MLLYFNYTFYINFQSIDNWAAEVTRECPSDGWKGMRCILTYK